MQTVSALTIRQSRTASGHRHSSTESQPSKVLQIPYKRRTLSVMRVRLPDNLRRELFESLALMQVGVDDAAEILGVSARTLRDWRKGKFTIPQSDCATLMKIAGLDLDIPPDSTLDDYWYAPAAAKKGGLAYMRTYGSLGDRISRKMGGRRSYEIRKFAERDIFTSKVIRSPEKSVDLAEFLGILIGDGGVTRYQVTVSLSSLVDTDYVPYVVNLGNTLFGIEPLVRYETDENCVSIIYSSARLVKFLEQQDLRPGNKLRNGLDMPTWVTQNRDYAIACTRGVFDTDGCVFAERHKIKGKLYSYPRLSFVSASMQLLGTVYDIFLSLGFKPNLRYRRVNLELRHDIASYFAIIGTSNPKHLRRWRLSGGVT
jgi:hypothetical protein